MIRRHGHDDAEALHRALESRTPARGEVRELVRTAEALCAAADAAPSDAFRTSLRESLMAEAATVLVPVAAAPRRDTTTVVAPVHGRGRRRLAGLATAAVVSVGTVGLVSSSATAVPGDALYTVKRGVENVELALHRDEAARGAYQLERAQTRLDEARTLLEGSSAQQAGVATVLEDFTEQAEDGSTSLFATYTEDASTVPVDAVNDFTAAAALRLGEMAESVPTEAAASFEAAATTVSELAVEAARLCDTCAETDVSRLVGAVSQAAAKPSADSAPEADEPEGSSAESGTGTPADTKVPAVVTTTQPPVVAAPVVPRPSATPPRIVSGITEPVVGAILGNDEQEGLVPGLLNGLLGTGKK